MNEINLAKLDLNLLLVLHALLLECNVTCAGEKIGLSQSATSHALGRLRQVFNDPLLVRSANKMVLTPRAQKLLVPLQKILLEMDQLIQPTFFDPKTALGTIQLAAADYGSAIVLPTVLKYISENAPHLNVQCHHWHSDILDLLRNGAIDLALGVIRQPQPSEFKFQTLLVEDYVCMVRANHPITQKDLTIESYVAWSHALIIISNSPGKSRVDTVLSDLGLARRVMLKLPHYLSVPVIIAQSDLIITLPRRIAMLFAQYANLAILEPSIELGNYK